MTPPNRPATRKTGVLVLAVFKAIGFCLESGTAGLPATGEAGPKVVLVAIDGVRPLELRDEAIFPELMRLKEQGLFLPGMQISNPAGISLPAYADIFAGRRQERIVSNDPPQAMRQLNELAAGYRLAAKALGLPARE